MRVRRDRFFVGDVVTWSSQASGKAKTKVGRVVAVVPPFTRPALMLPSDSPIGATKDLSAAGMVNHERYVVKLTETSRAKGMKAPRRVYYCPRTSALRVVTGRPAF